MSSQNYIIQLLALAYNYRCISLHVCCMRCNIPGLHSYMMSRPLTQQYKCHPLLAVLNSPVPQALPHAACIHFGPWLADASSGSEMHPLTSNCGTDCKEINSKKTVLCICIVCRGGIWTEFGLKSAIEHQGQYTRMVTEFYMTNLTHYRQVTCTAVITNYVVCRVRLQCTEEEVSKLTLKYLHLKRPYDHNNNNPCNN